jgi:glutamate/aspartate transport system substrate-binding protein
MGRRTLLRSAVFSVLLASVLPSVAQAGAVLDKIKASGAITIGHRESSIPFSYLDDRRRPVGYSMDICLHVVDAIKSALNAPLRVNYRLVTTKDRRALVRDGSVDLECGSTSNTLERQKEVAFSVTTFVAANRLVAKKSSKIRAVWDLRNKTVVSTADTTCLKQLMDLNERERHKMEILQGRDHAESFAMVEDGRATVFAMDDILLVGLVANSRNPSDYMITAQPLSVEPYAIMFQRDDPELKKLVDGAIVALYKSGEIHKLYNKWFMSAIPPKGANLNTPMSDILKRVIANPTDSGNPTVYF